MTTTTTTTAADQKWIAAFDLGTKNFAFAVRKSETTATDDGYVLLKNVPIAATTTRSDLDKLRKRQLCELFEDQLGISSAGRQKKELATALSTSLKKQGKLEPPLDLGMSMFKIMDDHSFYWERCETFLIERQMTVNAQALKLSHYLEAYLKIKYSYLKTRRPSILNYHSTSKTKKLGAPKLAAKKDRKNWTIAYAADLLKGDNWRVFQTMAKKDDVADVVCMIESFRLD